MTKEQILNKIKESFERDSKIRKVLRKVLRDLEDGKYASGDDLGERNENFKSFDDFSIYLKVEDENFEHFCSCFSSSSEMVSIINDLYLYKTEKEFFKEYKKEKEEIEQYYDFLKELNLKIKKLRKTAPKLSCLPLMYAFSEIY